MVMTQSPGSLAVSAGDMVTITCKSSQSPLQAEGRIDLAPREARTASRLLTCWASTWPAGVPWRFSGSGQGQMSLSLQEPPGEDMAVLLGAAPQCSSHKLQPQTQTSPQATGQGAFAVLAASPHRDLSCPATCLLISHTV
ncbi:Ig kappa chain V-IV region Len [Sciurus carolinensis]|uniref:Ig kappa chain V-IV region Len n=1 Tax=Sciurus carolinensis TaxID=30640 RepID=A0AA41MLH8_SCICA|nr:Ig kappa chain V-IV region Len [Sciurus carolinensis]